MTSSCTEYENNCDRNKNLSIEENFEKIKQFLKDVNYLRKHDARKIQLTIAINFISSKDTSAERVIHSKSDEIEIMVDDKADEVIKVGFEWLFNRYNRCSTGLQNSVRCSYFIFDCDNLLHCKRRIVNLKYDELYKDFRDWIKKSNIKFCQ